MNDDQTCIQLNQSEAERFLNWLDPHSNDFTFQTFAEKGKSGLAKQIPGTVTNLWSMLEFANRHKIGVAVTINETAGGRKSENVTRMRAVWHEDDNGYSGSFPLEPSIVVQSSVGKFHRYWLVDGDWPADDLGRAEFTAVMDRMVRDYGSDQGAKDISRAMRLPGTLHQKGAPQVVSIISPNDGSEPVRYTRQEVVSAFVEHPVNVSDAPATKVHCDTEVDLDLVASALAVVPADDRDTWLKVGMAFHHETTGSDQGFMAWDDWSRTTTAGNYNRTEQSRAWKSFRDHATPVTFATVFQLAIEHGWERQKADAPEFDLEGIPEERIRIQRHPHDLVETTIPAIRDRLADFGNYPAPAFFDGIEEIAKVIQGMASDDPAIGRDFYISSLAAGVGKTTTMIETIRTIIAMPAYHNVGVIVFLSQVSQIDAVRKQSGLSERDYSVIVSTGYQDKLPLGNPVPADARVLFTTQQMLERYVKKTESFEEIRDFWFNGKPRQVRIWDEAISPSKLHTLGVYKLHRLFDALIRSGLKSAVDDKLMPLAQSLQTAKDHDVFEMPDLSEYGWDAEAVADLYNEEGDRQAAEALWKLSGRSVRVRMDQWGSAALGYDDIFPEDLGPLLILDASGQLRKVYKDWHADRKGLRGLYSPRKSYSGLTIHYQDKGTGRDQYKKSQKSRYELYEGFVRTIKSIPEHEPILVVHFKASGDRREGTADIERELREQLPGRRNLKFCTWGQHTATNDYADCRHIILASVLQYPTSHTEALGRSAKRLLAEDDYSADEYARMELGEVAHNLLQAANRGAIRKLTGDSCPEGCHLYATFSGRHIPRGLLSYVFPDATVLDWTPVHRVTGNQARLAKLIEDEATSKWHKVPKAMFRDRLGVSKQAFSKLINEKLVDYLSTERGISIEVDYKELRIKDDKEVIIMERTPYRVGTTKNEWFPF